MWFLHIDAGNVGAGLIHTGRRRCGRGHEPPGRDSLKRPNTSRRSRITRPGPGVRDMTNVERRRSTGLRSGLLIVLFLWHWIAMHCRCQCQRLSKMGNDPTEYLIAQPGRFGKKSMSMDVSCQHANHVAQSYNSDATPGTVQSVAGSVSASGISLSTLRTGPTNQATPEMTTTERPARAKKRP